MNTSLISSATASTRSTFVRELHPACFAIVMATGIVSVAAHLRGFTGLSRILLVINAGVYIALWALTLMRMIAFRRQFIADLFDHGRSVGFLTTVAATCVLGNQFVVVSPRPQLACALWVFGIALWALINYSILTILTVKPEKPGLIEGINGGWLVAVVAAQAVATLGALVTPHLSALQDLAIFFSLMMWLGGGMLYIWIIVLIFYRYTFFALEACQLAPPYWINMGAMAISTLAGTLFAENAMHSPLLASLQPFIMGLTLMFWATATWWIPLLLALGAWRHIVRRVPLGYDVVYWSAVFPLGMYAACTHRLVRLVDQPMLDVIPQGFLWIAFGAWIVTLAGLLRRQLRWLTEGWRKGGTYSLP